MRVIVAVFIIVAGGACGGNSPTTPTPGPPPLAQPDLVAAGNATFPGDCPDDQCSYAFTLTNRGAGCGRAVRGTITLLVNGVEQGTDTWTLPAERVVRPNEQVEVADCCLAESVVAAATSVRIMAQGETVSCQ